jgi:hypothetical protein
MKRKIAFTIMLPVIAAGFVFQIFYGAFTDGREIATEHFFDWLHR